MRLQIERNSDVPMYLQLRDSFREAILSGELPGGTLLPPERKLAEELGVNRSTVVKAYDELKAEGLAEGFVGRGTTVLSQLFPHSGENGVAPLPWSQLLNEDAASPGGSIIRDMMREASAQDRISFATGVPDPSLYPVGAVRDIMRRLLADDRAAGAMLLPSPVPGQDVLRESIARYLLSRHVAVSAEDVFVLSGSQQGLDYSARLLVRPGDTVVVEDPTFFGAIRIFRNAGARLVGVPVDERGIRTDILEIVLQRFRPRLIYTLPTCQNPTGVTMALERRRELLQLAQRFRTPVLEDDPYSDLAYDAAPPPSLFATDPTGSVLSLGSFSKTLFLGVRIGWIVAPRRVLDAFTRMKQYTDLHTNTPSQFLVDRMLREGVYEEHLRVVRARYAARRDVMIRSLGEFAPPGVNRNTPSGGYYVWARVPPSVDVLRLPAAAARRGVSYLPGNAFFADGVQGASHMRLCFAAEPEDRIREGIRCLMDAVRECSGDVRAPERESVRPVI